MLRSLVKRISKSGWAGNPSAHEIGHRAASTSPSNHPSGWRAQPRRQRPCLPAPRWSRARRRPLVGRSRTMRAGRPRGRPTRCASDGYCDLLRQEVLFGSVPSRCRGTTFFLATLVRRGLRVVRPGAFAASGGTAERQLRSHQPRVLNNRVSGRAGRRWSRDFPHRLASSLTSDPWRCGARSRRSRAPGCPRRRRSRRPGSGRAWSTTGCRTGARSATGPPRRQR